MNNPLIFILISVGFLAVSALITALGYFIRSRFDGIDHQLSCNIQTHHDCYSTLSERFAGKVSTNDRLDRHTKRMDDHDGAIRRLEGHGRIFGDRDGDRG